MYIVNINSKTGIYVETLQMGMLHYAVPLKAGIGGRVIVHDVEECLESLFTFLTIFDADKLMSDRSSATDAAAVKFAN